MPGDYSSSVSGDRPEEVERIKRLIEETPPGPDIEWTGYHNGTEYVNGGPIEPAPGPMITEDWGINGAIPLGDEPEPEDPTVHADTGFVIRKATDITVKPVRWIWYGRLPLGKAVVVDGDPKLGKTTMVLDLGARVSTGAAMPLGTSKDERDAGAFLVFSTEDDPGDTLKPRLIAAGADLDRVYVEYGRIDGTATALDSHLEQLEHLIRLTHARLVMIDPLMGYLGKDTKSSIDQDIRQVLGPLGRMAARYECSFALIRHLNKSPSTNAMHRGGGSIGISGAARGVLLVAKDPKADRADLNPRRILASVGSSLSATAPSLAFRMKANADDVVRIDWESMPTGETPYELLAPRERQERENDGSRVGMAMGWLAERLQHGAVPYLDLVKEAAQDDITESTLKKARREIPGSGWHREGFQGPIYWHLKGREKPATEPSEKPSLGVQSDLDLQ